jgi:CheY-like chemotaxis protein
VDPTPPADDPSIPADDLAALQERLAGDPAALAALERLAGKLSEARRARAELLSDLNHELRTPLGALLGFSGLLCQDLSLGGEQRAHAEVIHRCAEQLLSLIDELTGSTEDGGAQPFDLHHFLDDLADMLCLRAAGGDVPLRFDRPPDLPRLVRGDVLRIRQLLLLLLGNLVGSIEAVAVRIQLERSPGLPAAVLRFQVAAAGLDPATLRLHPFVRTETGLQAQEISHGLDYAERLADQLGGTLYAVPHQLHLSLPIGVGAEPAEPDARRITGLAPDQDEFRILVAEDRWQNRQLLTQALARVGFHVREAADGREALHLWETWRPHLVWMDMRMPLVSGIEATQRIKQSPRGASTVVVALTASAFEADEATARAAGCDDFVRKPLQLQQVFAKLGQHLGVRFIYDDPGAAREQPGPAVLDGLPEPWLSALQQACVQADIGAIRRMIEFIRGQAPRAAAVLLNMADHYDYGAIIDLARHALHARGAQ